MICDSHGRELRRKIGFEGGLVETKLTKAEMVDCVSGWYVDVSETEGAEGETKQSKTVEISRN